MESLTIRVPYLLHQAVSPFADDESMIFQIERCDGDCVYITWPTCPFYPDDVARINNGTVCCIIKYMVQRITNNSVTHTLELIVLKGLAPPGSE